MKFDAHVAVEQNRGRFPLAIVGIGCRFPGGCDDVDSFWKMLRDGRSAIRKVPADRWNVDRFYHQDSAIPGTIITDRGGFVENLAGFDAHFWGLSPREAMRMDPQQRWLLEVAWEALEDAGAPPRQLRGTRVGVFVGVAGTDYGGIQLGNTGSADFYTMSGSTLSIVSNRISYMLDLTGPSASVDTACSSALVAVWLACRSIWSEGCVAALAGGVNAMINPNASIGFSKASMLSPNGECFAFDSRANGYVRGEGAGAIYIKPLAKAMADGNRIYAIIRGAESNQDGHTSAMPVPGVDGQSAMLRMAYAASGIDPASVAYVEAHGTGTPVGDPIEAEALGLVLGLGRPQNQPCLIGSVKTNIGHLEAGSGIAGIIKAALILHHDQIPPSLNFEKPNPNIHFDSLGLQVVSELRDLPCRNGTPPVIGVNSFGFGGTNAHIVLEKAPPVPAPQPPAKKAQRPFILPISARDELGLRRYVEAYRQMLADPTIKLTDVCCAAGEHKDHHDHRLAVIGNDATQIRRRLAGWLRGSVPYQGIVAGQPAPGNSLVFVFTGQGGQWWGMGRQLLEREPVVQSVITEIDEIFRPLAGWSLREEMSRDEAASNIDRTDVAQPAIFALQVALAELWKSWGVKPGKVIGHSVGEVAAALIAGIYSLEDAVRIIFHRSRLQNTTGGRGRMLAVGIPAAEARQRIGSRADRIQIAVFNSPSLVTLSGDSDPLEKIAAELKNDAKFVRWLRINYAFHTHQMEPIRDELLHALAGIQPQPSRLPFISTVTGGVLPGDRLDASYWWKNVRQPVLFAPAIAALVRGKEDTFLEIGPHPALAGSIDECLKEQGQSGTVFHSLRRQTDDSEEMLTNLAGLHVRGKAVDWRAVSQGYGTLVRLPHYPWNRESFWLEARETHRARLAPLEHPLLGLRTDAALPTWEFDLHPGRLAYLKEHRFWDGMVLPSTAYVEIGLALASRLFPGAAQAVEDIEIMKGLFIVEDRLPTVQTVFEPEGKTFAIYSASGDKQAWDLHARGRLVPVVPDDPAPVDLQRLREPLTEYLDQKRYYEDREAAGYQFGPSFTNIQNAWRVHGEALAEIAVPASIQDGIDGYHIHPAVLDACLQVVKGLRTVDPSLARENFYLPYSFRRIRLRTATPTTRLWAHGRLLLDDGKSLISDIFVYDDEGRRVTDILGFRVDRVEQKKAADDLENCCYQLHWEPRRLKGSGTAGSCDFCPTADMIAATRVRAAELYRNRELDTYYERFIPRLDALVSQSVQNAWLHLGWRCRRGDRFRGQDLIEQLGIAEAHYKLAQSQLREFAELGLIRSTGEDEWEVVRVPESKPTEAACTALAAEYPRFESEVALNQRVAPHLATALSGELDPVELLFPGGSFDLLDRFYSEAADLPALNEMIVGALTRAVAALPPRRVLRVLEVGAGTGSLTKVLLPVLPADRTEYLFTDLGPAFLVSAKKKFSGYPWVEYQTFDLEKDAKSQGIEAGSYDVILATLVLHATADLRQTLANLRGCLADGGLLIFVELFPRRWSWNSFFGLLSGWWRFTDASLRRHSPLLERAQWHALLTDCGFRDVGAAAATIDEGAAQQALFIAVASAKQPTAAAPRTPEQYLVFADRGGVADALVERMRKRGDRAIRIRSGDAYRAVGDDEFIVPIDSEDDFRRIRGANAELTGIVHCWCLDQPAAAGLSGEELVAAQQGGVLSLLRLMHIVAESPVPRVCVVTRDMYAVRGGDLCDGLGSAPVVGLLRVAGNEFFPARFTVIDLDANMPRSTDETTDLFDEVTIGDEEQEIAYRGGRRHVLRMNRARLEELPTRTQDAIHAGGAVTPFRLQTSRPGILTNLSLNEAIRRELRDDEIEVRVKAAGINFRDLMKALGTYPGNPIDLLWFGDDVAGVVERVGKNVRQLRPGDEVAGMAPYGFRSHAVTEAWMIFAKPPAMSFEEAATLPTVFLTAHYALNELARVQPGERILIHAGTGGVGQAAIQIAKRQGLEIFATAGSVEKRQMLQEMGVQHVMNSRTLQFADEVMAATGGRGVDVVLNSLAGDFIPKSLAVLAPFGRFLEIGKIDVYKNSKIGLDALKNNISYFVIDLGQHLLHKPAYVGRLFAELSVRFKAGDYQPLPNTVFPITDVVEAFRYMAQGKHVGKNVLSFDQSQIPIGPCTEDGHLFRSDATYLITGGAGGFGLEIAKWMARQGARHLVLMSRSGPRDEAAREAIGKIRNSGAAVVDARGDVSKFADVRSVVAAIQHDMPPLAGIVHAAMIVDDDALTVLDDVRFNAAMAPKIAGAWNLHTATLNLSLEHFICFSSFSSVIGLLKQANYNAGNIFLDALAYHRQAHGLPALTINWGALLGAGFVERNRKTAEFLGKLGLGSFNMDEAMRLFKSMIRRRSAQIVVARADWPFFSRACPIVKNSLTYASLISERGEMDRGGSLLARLQAARPDARTALVEDFLAVQVAGVFGVSDEKVDRNASLSSLGIDSLMAVDLTTRIEREIGTGIPMGSMLSGPNIKTLSQTLLRLMASSLGAEHGTTATETTDGRVTPLEKVAYPSDEFPLSEGQQALWLLYRLEPASPVFNLSCCGQFHPMADTDLIRRAFSSLFDRHPMLDVTFAEVDGQPKQRLRKGRTIEYHEHDVRELSKKQINDLLIDCSERPFDLETGPVVRLDLFRTDDDTQLALLGMHHIVGDAWSIALVLNDLIETHFALKSGQRPKKLPQPVSYQDFVAWEQKLLDGPAGRQLAEYWKREVGNAPLQLNLPIDHARSRGLTPRSATYGFSLGDDLSHKVLTLAAEQNATLFVTLLSAFQVLLHRLCRQDDLLLGCPLANRYQRELTTVIGLFTNVMPLRSRVDDDPTLIEILKRNAAKAAWAIDHQQYPFARLVRDLKIPRDFGRSPAVQAVFSMERIPGLDDHGITAMLIGQGGHKLYYGDVSVESVDLTLRQSRFEIALVVDEAGGVVYGCWQFDRNLFEPATVARFNELFGRLLAEVCRDPWQRISEIDLFGADDGEAGADSRTREEESESFNFDGV